MRRLLDWLAKDISFNGSLILVFIFVIVNFISIWVASVVLSCFNINFTRLSDREIQLLIESFPVPLFIWAFFEELFFRFFPLAVAVFSFGVSYAVLFVAIIFSVIFGWMHGGFIYVFIQGITGLLLSLLFLKCGGFQRKYLKALFVTTVAHFSSNSFLLLVYLIGQS